MIKINVCYNCFVPKQCKEVDKAMVKIYGEQILHKIEFTEEEIITVKRLKLKYRKVTVQVFNNQPYFLCKECVLKLLEEFNETTKG